jgi:hypothetical protein
MKFKILIFIVLFQSFHFFNLLLWAQENPASFELTSTPQTQGLLKLVGKGQYHPEAYFWSENNYARMEKFMMVFEKFALGVMKNYSTSDKLQKYFQFNGNVDDILKGLSSRVHPEIPLELGCLRPDVIFSSVDGNPYICEINARFCTNGFFISQALNLGLLQHWGKFGDTSASVSEEAERIFNIPTFYFNLVRNSQNFEPKKSIEVGIVKGSEKGWDIHLLKKWLNGLEIDAKKIKVRFVRPENLTLEVGQQKPRDEHGAFDYFFLEITQDEILTELKPEVLNYFILHPHLTTNNLGVIFLLHDKRLMGLPHTDPELLKSFLTEEEISILQNVFVKTSVLGHLSHDKKDLLKNCIDQKNKLILKANLSGKGEGIYVGENCPDEMWSGLITNNDFSDYILQEFIPTLPLILNNEASFFVGTLLVQGGKLVGPGILRFKNQRQGPIVNGGIFMGGLKPKTFFKTEKKDSDHDQKIDENLQ